MFWAAKTSTACTHGCDNMKSNNNIVSRKGKTCDSPFWHESKAIQTHEIVYSNLAMPFSPCVLLLSLNMTARSWKRGESLYAEKHGASITASASPAHKNDAHSPFLRGECTWLLLWPMWPSRLAELPLGHSRGKGRRPHPTQTKRDNCLKILEAFEASGLDRWNAGCNCGSAPQLQM